MEREVIREQLYNKYIAPTKRKKKGYIGIEIEIPILNLQKKPVDGTKYQSIKFKPEKEDLTYLRTFKFEDLTFRGTIEFRSVCCQPIRDCMTVAAFHLGLQENLQELDELLQEDHVLYHHGYTATELRRMFTYAKLPSFVEEDKLYALAWQVVELAEDGLKKRGKGEEIYLEPLYSRIRDRQNPARQMLTARNNGVPLEDIIQSFSELKEAGIETC